MNNDWREAVEEIRNKVFLPEIVEEFTRLKRSGVRYSGLCPFHDEKTPSFSVHASKGYYKCFGCGAGGDAFQFVMEMRGLTFPEAVQSLADRYGVELPKFSGKSNTQQTDELKDGAAVLKFAAHWYHSVFLRSPKAAQAREYIARRNLDASAIEIAEIGWSPDAEALPKVLQKKGFSLELAAKMGLVSKYNGQFSDRYFGRIIFPIIDHRGRYVGFGARVFGDGPVSVNAQAKYVNTSETALFQKQHILYGLHQSMRLKKRGQILLTEGYFDVLRAIHSGLPSCAAMGTALSQRQATLLARSFESVVLALDGDDAGYQATLKMIPTLVNAGIETFVYRCAEGEDLDTLINHANAPNEFLQSVQDETAPAVEWFADELCLHDGSIQGKIQAKEKIAEAARAFTNIDIRNAIAKRASTALDLAVTVASTQNQTDHESVYQPAPQQPDIPADDPATVQHDTLQQLISQCDSPARRQSLLDHPLHDWLPEDVTQYLMANQPLPARFSSDFEQATIDEQQWYNLLNAVHTKAKKHAFEHQKKHLVAMLDKAISEGDQSRVAHLQSDLAALLEGKR